MPDWSKRQAKRDPNSVNMVLGRKYKGDSDAGVYDIHPTPPGWTDVLMRSEKFVGSVWENACGDGAMSKVLALHYSKVVSTNHPQQGFGKELDFITAKRLLADNIITNPPFKFAYEFIVHGLDLLRAGGGAKMALLLSEQYLGTLRRTADIWTNPARRPYRVIWIPNKMPNPYTGGSYSFYHVWCLWDVHRTAKQTVLDWVPTRKAKEIANEE